MMAAHGVCYVHCLRLQALPVRFAHTSRVAGGAGGPAPSAIPSFSELGLSAVT